MHRPAAKVGTPFVRSANARFVEARTLPSPAAPARPAAAAAPRQPADNSSYVDLVARSFEGTILRYSRRLALLEQADARGIPRTEARQIIAAAQKRAQHAISPRSSRPRVTRRKVLRAAVFVGSYAAVAAAWCWILR